ncbi:MAG: hypothetical protein EXR68_02000 [Dehalococcoidia bacterium]|nr:hypothetical protein [Dehalococcoidia bacterium]
MGAGFDLIDVIVVVAGAATQHHVAGGCVSRAEALRQYRVQDRIVQCRNRSHGGRVPARDFVEQFRGALRGTFGDLVGIDLVDRAWGSGRLAGLRVADALGNPFDTIGTGGEALSHLAARARCLLSAMYHPDR